MDMIKYCAALAWFFAKFVGLIVIGAYVGFMLSPERPVVPMVFGMLFTCGYWLYIGEKMPKFRKNTPWTPGPDGSI